MSWWKRKKCPLCKTVIKKKMVMAEVRIQTADGLLELDVCPKCAHIIDKSADVLMGKQRNVPERTEREDPSPSEEMD